MERPARMRVPEIAAPATWIDHRRFRRLGHSAPARATQTKRKAGHACPYCRRHLAALQKTGTLALGEYVRGQNTRVDAIRKCSLGAIRAVHQSWRHGQRSR